MSEHKQTCSVTFRVLSGLSLVGVPSLRSLCGKRARALARVRRSVQWFSSARTKDRSERKNEPLPLNFFVHAACCFFESTRKQEHKNRRSAVCTITSTSRSDRRYAGYLFSSRLGTRNFSLYIEKEVLNEKEPGLFISS